MTNFIAHCNRAWNMKVEQLEFIYNPMNIHQTWFNWTTEFKRGYTKANVYRITVLGLSGS